jgi:hypothetical protein
MDNCTHYLKCVGMLLLPLLQTGLFWVRAALL